MGGGLTCGVAGDPQHWTTGEKLRKAHAYIQTAPTSGFTAGITEQCNEKYGVRVAEFCANPENRNVDVGRAKCKAIGDSDALAKAYCAVGDRIKTDSTCSSLEIGTTLNEQLAGQWCAAHKKDNWCRCYNNIVGVCEADPSAAGCAATQVEHDLIVKDLPDSKAGTTARHALDARKHCLGKVCANSSDTYIPEQRPDCALNLDLCIQELNVGGNLVGSGINMNCDIQQEGGQQDGEVERQVEGPSGQIILSEEDVQIFKYGFGGTLASSVLSLCICILLIASMNMSRK